MGTILHRRTRLLACRQSTGPLSQVIQHQRPTSMLPSRNIEKLTPVSTWRVTRVCLHSVAWLPLTGDDPQKGRRPTLVLAITHSNTFPHTCTSLPGCIPPAPTTPHTESEARLVFDIEPSGVYITSGRSKIHHLGERNYPLHSGRCSGSRTAHP